MSLFHKKCTSQEKVIASLIPEKNIDIINNYQAHHSINLFDHIPSEWVADEALLRRGSVLFSRMENHHRQLLNSILFIENRFIQFCFVPSSLGGHHNTFHGNLIHTIEVAENTLELCSLQRRVNISFALMLAFLHDIGKLAEYQYLNNKWYLSDVGKLIGHKMTTFQFVIEALYSNPNLLNEQERLSLLHAQTAIPNIPDWAGLRKPYLLETEIVATADRISCNNYLVHEHHLNDETGLHGTHPHLGKYLLLV